MTTIEEQGRILLVDHSRGALMFQETILRRRDKVIFTALSGSEGMLKAKRERPQLIVFGFDLFDMNAPEFCRDIRSDDVISEVSLLLVCERVSPEHADLCMAAGCNDVIYRPLQKRELDEKVETLTRIPVRRELPYDHQDRDLARKQRSFLSGAQHEHLLDRHAPRGRSGAAG